jgi:hypothetical protein
LIFARFRDCRESVHDFKGIVGACLMISYEEVLLATGASGGSVVTASYTGGSGLLDSLGDFSETSEAAKEKARVQRAGTDVAVGTLQHVRTKDWTVEDVCAWIRDVSKGPEASAVDRAAVDALVTEARAGAERWRHEAGASAPPVQQAKKAFGFGMATGKDRKRKMAIASASASANASTGAVGGIRGGKGGVASQSALDVPGLMDIFRDHPYFIAALKRRYWSHIRPLILIYNPSSLTQSFHFSLFFRVKYEEQRATFAHEVTSRAIPPIAQYLPLQCQLCLH